MIRLAHLPILVFAAALGLAAADHALAQQQNSADAKKKVAKPSAADDKTKGAEKADSKPLLVASFGDWGVYQTQAGKGRVCYTLAQPKDRAPSNLNRDPAYAFISDRPGEGVRNEVSFIMGFDVANPTEEPKGEDKAEKSKAKAAKTAPVKEATATVNDQTFELLAKSTNLWVKNAAKEGQLIDEMRKGAKLEVRATSKKGNMTTDTYSLSGFSQALERVLKDCPSGK
jgi:Invasion associated locus B (IalB) protein